MSAQTRRLTSSVAGRTDPPARHYPAVQTLAFLFVVMLVWLRSTSSRAETAADLRGEEVGVFNVKAYGAIGDGSTPDESHIQKAIAAAIAAGGGTVFFPAGSYLINKTVTNSRVDLVSLVGVGMASQLKIATSIGFSFPRLSIRAAAHSGRIAHLRFACTDIKLDTAVQITDPIIAPSFEDLDVTGCNVGFDLVNTSYWTERLVAINVSDDNNNHLFHYDQNPDDANNSYGYGTYSGIYINKYPGQDVFFLTGGAYLYHSSFVIKGNFSANATGSSIFNLQGGAGQSCPGAAWNVFDIAVEGSGYAVVNAANNGCTGGSTGNALVAGVGNIDVSGAKNATTSLIHLTTNAPVLVGLLTTTANPSDTLSTPLASPGSTCYVQPANPVAAKIISDTYVSATTWGRVSISHSPKKGGLFQVWCQ